MTPFGWRVASAIVGSLMVMVMIRLARRVTRSTLLGLVAGLLMCFDGLQLVLSRLALLDIFLAFFVLCAVSCMVADRDWVRDRLAPAVPSGTPAVAGRVGPAAAVAALAAGDRRLLGPGARHQVVGAVPAGGVRAADVGLGRRRAPLVRRTTGAAEVGRHRRPPGPGLRRAAPAADLRRHLDRLAAARRGLRAAPLQHAVRPLLGQLPAPRRARLLPRAVAVAALAVALPPRRLRLPHRASSTTASTSTSPTRGAGWCSTARSGWTPSSTSSPASRAAPRRRARPACARCCCSATRWCGGSPRSPPCGRCSAGSRAATGATAWSSSASLVTWLPWLRYDDRPIFSYYAVTILPFLILGATCCSARCWDAPTPQPCAGPSGPPAVGCVVVLVAALVRVVLADLDRPAGDQPRVGAADVVPPLDLAGRGAGSGAEACALGGLRARRARTGCAGDGDGAAVAALLGGHPRDGEGDDEHADDSRAAGPRQVRQTTSWSSPLG